jgi:hypothetical protein
LWIAPPLRSPPGGRRIILAEERAGGGGMEKQQLEALLAVDGVAPDLPPIERYLDLLATERDLPDAALGMCAARIEEAGPALRAAVAKAADGAALTKDEARLAFRGVHILGAARDEKAWPILRRLLNLPIDALDHVLGDALGETLSRIVAGVFDGDCDALFEEIADRELDEFVRDALFGAATFLTFDGRIDRRTMRDFLQRFDRDRLADDGDFAWIGWLEAIAFLGFRDMTPLVEKAFADGRLPERVLEFKHFEQDLAAAEQRPDDRERFEDRNLGYVGDVVQALDWVRWKDDSDEIEDGWTPSWKDLTSPASMPVANPWRHVGRNDPCPCGSGKKAKKCCLASGDAQSL